MKDLVIITGIILFWGFITLILTGINADPLMTGQDLTGNATFDSTLPSGQLNLTDIEFTSPTTLGVFSYLDMFVRMFTFRLPQAFPAIINLIVGLMNYLLVGIFALTMFRLVRHGGG